MRTRGGTYVFAAAAISAGLCNLVWGDFATNWQPTQAFGDHVPGRTFLAYLTALWLVVAGAALLREQTRRAGALGLAIVYGTFAVFWLPRLYYVPHFLGFNLPLLIGVLDGLGQQVILIAAAIVVYVLQTRSNANHEPMPARIARIAFGLSTIVFGVAHFTGRASVTPLVPAWIPLGANFWAIVTGAGFILSGVAISTRWLAALGARLLALMLAIFSLLVWLPQLFRFTHDQSAWGGNAYNLAAVGAALIIADWLSRSDETNTPD